MFLIVDGTTVEVSDVGATLLDVLRDDAGVRSVKDGCSPQGQCGCCTVLVDGRPRVSCVTPVRRVRGREITTLDGLSAEVSRAWGEAFTATGASQCGFCTPGIICRFEGLRANGTGHDDRETAAKALQAHLCRCTGWRSIVDAWSAFGSEPVASSPAAARRAELEGGVPQRVGPEVALGHGGFADDTAPHDALVAVPSSEDGWIVAETRGAALRLAGKVQGRRTTAAFDPPLALPTGDFDRTLRTTWVEPAYLETDASWCRPGGEPASPLANGGAFGAKVDSEVGAVARRLADQHQRPVRVLYSREDAVRRGPKRPPVAAGINADGTGVMRVVRTPGIAAAIAAVAPRLVVEEVDVAGPPTSTSLRGAGWVEAVVLLSSVRDEIGWIDAPGGGAASAAITDDGAIVVRVRAGHPLDETVLRSYCVGAAHMALSWVTSESLGVDADGEIHDLTIRSFGVLRAVDTPPISVSIEPDDGDPVNGSDAVFAAVAAAVWRSRGFAPDWPTGP
jgi:aerobic-type carbon monoxide dehydrogenase small subunit (CoxS/CutS family)